MADLEAQQANLKHVLDVAQSAVVAEAARAERLDAKARNMMTLAGAWVRRCSSGGCHRPLWFRC
jgi:hypothetical protein